jgi:cysteine synthase A
MLRLKRLIAPGSGDVFAKLEYLNPGGSVKDRAAIGIIQRAEQEGRLKPGGTIVEATAGNTGIGLALIGVNRGYKVALFVPERFSEEKVKIMRARGVGDAHSGRSRHARSDQTGARIRGQDSKLIHGPTI